MVAITYGVARAAAAVADRTKTVSGASIVNGVKTFFSRFMAALIEARMKQARREIAMHAYLLPKDWDIPLGARKDLARKDLPNGGW